jgi:hypothetical protein
MSLTLLLPIDLRRPSLPRYSGQHEPSRKSRRRLELTDDSERRVIRHEVDDGSYESDICEWPSLLRCRSACSLGDIVIDFALM